MFAIVIVQVQVVPVLLTSQLQIFAQVVRDPNVLSM